MLSGHIPPQARKDKLISICMQTSDDILIDDFMAQEYIMSVL